LYLKLFHRFLYVSEINCTRVRNRNIENSGPSLLKVDVTQLVLIFYEDSGCKLPAESAQSSALPFILSVCLSDDRGG